VDECKPLVIGSFADKQDAARAYDAEVRRRKWTHLKRLNFPDPAIDDARQPPSYMLLRRRGRPAGRGAG